MAEKKKSNKKETIPKTQPLFSFYSNTIVTRWTDDECILEFAQEPKGDNGLLPSCRIYITPSFLKPIISQLQDVKKDYEKKYGKLKGE